MARDRREFDALRRLVPWHLSKVFAGRRRLLRYAKKLEGLRNDLALLSQEPYCRRLDIRGLLSHLEAARALVLRGAPFGQCGCQSARYGCEKCEGQRWLTVDQMPYPKITEPS